MSQQEACLCVLDSIHKEILSMDLIDITDHVLAQQYLIKLSALSRMFSDTKIMKKEGFIQDQKSFCALIERYSNWSEATKRVVVFKERPRTDSVDLLEGIDEDAVVSVSGSDDRTLCSVLVNAMVEGNEYLQFHGSLKYSQLLYAVRCELIHEDLSEHLPRYKIGSLTEPYQRLVHYKNEQTTLDIVFPVKWIRQLLLDVVKNLRSNSQNFIVPSFAAKEKNNRLSYLGYLVE